MLTALKPRKTIKSVAYQVLRKANKPLHVSEITERVLKQIGTGWGTYIRL